MVDCGYREGSKMPQLSFTDAEYGARGRKTKREQFLNQMEQIIPWSAWVERIAPYYPEGKRGRKPIGIEIMLRMYLMQIWFNLSDEGIEDAIYDIYPMRKFLGINFVEDKVPDATTLLHFRHMLEKHEIGKELFKDIVSRLDKAGLMMHGGSIVDATIVNAPSSTKNRTGKRDPEMHQTRKGNQWYHGMKAHIGVDAGSGYVHSVTATAANVHDIREAHNLVREDDMVVYGDSGYMGIGKRVEIREDEHLARVEYRTARRPKCTTPPKSQPFIDWEKRIENRKSSIRCKVEHPFLIVKKLFGYGKVVYRGIQKNLNRLFLLFGSANLLMCSRAGRTEDFATA